jgi:enoyl-CoA hydratase/carnithine racemase
VTAEPRVSLEVDDVGIATVELAGSTPLNLYDLAMRDQLIEALRALTEIDEVRAVVIRARGPHFSAGADLAEFGSAESLFVARRIRWRRDPWGLLLGLPQPTVVALHGWALGAGLELALCCDRRICGPGTRLALPETKLGMLPSAGGSQTLPRWVGVRRTLPIVLGAEPIGAEEALELGIVDRVAEDPDTAAHAEARHLASLDPAVLRAAVRLLRGAADLPLARALDVERGLSRHVARGLRA